ncbi:glycosyltransferase [Gemella haemolysans]|uniref:glycosyltransferase n=1 Tax=Gemella haemolysans TaxID=1379 RepID=UPI00195CE8EB|nr:glycosyltransferase [Gemella haemolysans]VTX69911.1 N-acetylgalactosamine-N,N '-diacetylbacillosaminyl-diphospho-undecaprenol 4-alpha-N-acetylgalactosaminyltransferase [Gemella haemolysans]
MKKVLIVIPSYSKGGGAEKILSNILNNGDFSEYQIDIVEIDRGNNGLEDLPENIKVIKSYYHEKYPNIIRFILEQFGKRFPRALRKYLIKKDDYDVEIMFEVMYPDIPFSKRNIKKIYWVHGSIEDFSNTWRENRFREYFSDATKIVSISNKTEKSILNLYPNQKAKMIRIYNGYKFNEIIEKSKEGISENIPGKSICSIGRIEEQKGSDRTLELVRILHEKGYKYHMYYIGTGVLEETLKSRVEKYNLTEYIHFVGYQKNPYKYLKHMKCLVSMSKQEGFPGVYVEALSLNVPFVSTDVGGAEELSRDGKFGKIIYNDEQAVEEIIRYVERTQECEKGIKEFLNKLSLEKQVQEFKKLLVMEERTKV